MVSIVRKNTIKRTTLYLCVCVRERNIIIKAGRSNQLHMYRCVYEVESDQENTDEKGPEEHKYRILVWQHFSWCESEQ